MKQLTAEDKENIRTLHQDERFKGVLNLLEAFLDAAKETCVATRDDHRYHQGRAVAAVEIMRMIDEICRPPAGIAKNPWESSYTNFPSSGFRRVS